MPTRPLQPHEQGYYTYIRQKRLEGGDEMPPPQCECGRGEIVVTDSDGKQGCESCAAEEGYRRCSWCGEWARGLDNDGDDEYIHPRCRDERRVDTRIQSLAATVEYQGEQIANLAAAVGRLIGVQTRADAEQCAAMEERLRVMAITKRCAPAPVLERSEP